ncbi:PRELI-like family-domain-containing protein [Melampsora americana]|nr:PRELI-like family-domain-containing protein [Melampsora americana]
MLHFQAEHIFPFSFRDVALGIWHKYPNHLSEHIRSVDVLDRSFLPDGTLRTERLITIRQSAPRWIMKLVGGAEEQFVREVIFSKPAGLSGFGSPAMILMGSVNLSMSSIMICKEKIRYEPSPNNPKQTIFKQIAEMEAQGRLAAGQTWQAIGKQIESWGRDRFANNAATGREGFTSVLNARFSGQGSSELKQENKSESASQPSPQNLINA